MSNLPAKLTAQNVARQFTASNGDVVAFLEYKPAAHDAVGNTGTITNGSYVSSDQATENSGCSGARTAMPAPSKEVKDNKPAISKIYPNPTEGLVQIELNATVAKPVSVNILDMSGKYLSINKRPLIEGKNRILLNIASLPAGIYIIEIGDGKAIVEKYKVLKQ